MNEYLLLCYAIAAASRPDSTVVLTEQNLRRPHILKAHRKKPLPQKQVRRFRGIFEHKDTPIARRHEK